MEVYALIGASGTGKSHNANKVLQKYHIDVMIDDFWEYNTEEQRKNGAEAFIATIASVINFGKENEK